MKNKGGAYHGVKGGIVHGIIPTAGKIAAISKKRGVLASATFNFQRFFHVEQGGIRLNMPYIWD
jgi:hypothetical protein